MTVAEKRKPLDLKNYLLNVQVYGDPVDEHFVQLVREHGIVEPLDILRDNTIISGHRRRQAAIIAGIPEVPVVVHDLSDADEIRLLWCLKNEYRQKTNEQKARVYEIYLDAERRLAKRRQRGAGGAHIGELGKVSNPGRALPQSFGGSAHAGESARRAAARAGISHPTAAKASEVVGAIDAAETRGDTGRAESLRQSLNKSVAGAHAQLCGGPGRPVPHHVASPGTPDKLIDTLLGRIIRALDDRARATGAQDSALHKGCLAAIGKFVTAWSALRKGEPREPLSV